MKLFVFTLVMMTLFKIHATAPMQTESQQQQEQSLAGSDSDGNGVWDYIDQYINQTSSDEKTRAAMRQFARSIQGGLLNATDKKMSLEYARKSDRATECLFFLYKKEAYTMSKKLEAAILNTKSRSRAFITFSNQSAGETFQSTPFSKMDSSCAEK